MRFATFTLTLMAVASAAAAQDGPRRPMLSDTCRAETVKICPPTGDRGAMRSCVRANQDKFSEGCRKEFADMRARMQQMRAERGGDMPSAPPADAPQ